MPSSKKKRAMDVLDNVYTVLDTSKGLLDLAPVPGLSAAADVVLAIIDQVKVHIFAPCLYILTANALVRLLQKMEANKETVAALSKKIEQLKDIIINVVRTVEHRAASRQMNSEETTKLWKDLQATDIWRARVDRLQESVHFGGGPYKYVY